MRQTLDISWETITKVFLAGFILYLLFLTRDIVVWFFFALIISILLEPAVNFLQKLKLPKVLAVVLVYLSIFGALGLVIYLLSPVFVFEIQQFAQNIPQYFAKISPILEAFGVIVSNNFQDFTLSFADQLKDSST